MALTIYERYGGFPTIRKVVSDFYEQALDSPLLAHHFEDVNMARLIDHQTRFISFLVGGPVSQYTDQHLQRVHARFGITLEELDVMVEVLGETLEDHGFSAEDRATVEQELRKRQASIVTGRASGPDETSAGET